MGKSKTRLPVSTAALLAMFVTIATTTTACSQVSHSSPQDNSATGTDATNTTTTTTTTTSTTGSGYSYFLLKAESPDGIIQSSTLKQDATNGCYLANLYDFPDDIFGDDLLDNLTTQTLQPQDCARLTLAQQIASNGGGACTPTSITLTSADKSAITIDSNIAGLLASLGSTATVDPNDLKSTLTTIDLDADCVCSMTASPGAFSAEAKLPPPLALCAQKFARYAPYAP